MDDGFVVLCASEPDVPLLRSSLSFDNECFSCIRPASRLNGIVNPTKGADHPSVTPKSPSNYACYSSATQGFVWLRNSRVALCGGTAWLPSAA